GDGGQTPTLLRIRMDGCPTSIAINFSKTPVSVRHAKYASYSGAVRPLRPDEEGGGVVLVLMHGQALESVVASRVRKDGPEEAVDGVDLVGGGLELQHDFHAHRDAPEVAAASGSNPSCDRKSCCVRSWFMIKGC